MTSIQQRAATAYKEPRPAVTLDASATVVAPDMHSYRLRGNNRTAALANFDAVTPAAKSDRHLPKKLADCPDSTLISTTPQSTHCRLLSFESSGSDCAQGTRESVQFAGSGRSREYCKWWRENQGGDSLFGVCLIGNANSPCVCTAIAVSDLAFVRLSFLTRFQAEVSSGHCKNCN